MLCTLQLPHVYIHHCIYVLAGIIHDHMYNTVCVRTTTQLVFTHTKVEPDILIASLCLHPPPPQCLCTNSHVFAPHTPPSVYVRTVMCLHPTHTPPPPPVSMYEHSQHSHIASMYTVHSTTNVLQPHHMTLHHCTHALRGNNGIDLELVKLSYATMM